MTKSVPVLVVGAFALILLVGFAGRFLLGGGQTLGQINYGATFSAASTTVNTTATQVFAVNRSAAVRTITNQGNVPVYLHFKTVATTTGVAVNSGIVLNASATYVMTENYGNLWQGLVYAIAPTTTLVATSQQ